MSAAPLAAAWWMYATDALVAAKRSLGLTVSVCLPARDEAATVAGVVGPVRRELMDAAGLVDELVVVDDGSVDGTAGVAEAAGARVVATSDILAEEGPGYGKGNVIWRSLAATSGDLVCWLDADIRNFDTRFVTGLLGPLLSDPEVAFVKGHYRRPLDGAPTGGGRVSELTARPALSRFFPELAAFAQPLAGEYGGRRALLEAVPMVEGWGVEVALLIDVWRAVGFAGMAQVDLGVREHRNRPLDELGPTAMAVLNTVLDRAGIHGAPPLLRADAEGSVEAVAVTLRQRPPIRTCPGYRAGRHAHRSGDASAWEPVARP